MSIKNTTGKYGRGTQLLHGIIAILFIMQFALVYSKQYVVSNDGTKLSLLMLHKSIGFSLLFIGLVFILWRCINTKPGYPKKMARWEVWLANTNHRLLYLLAFIMPLTGVIMSMSSGKGIKWFGHPVPNLLAKNENLAGIFYNTHVYLSYLILVLLFLHIAGSLKHHYIDKNNILQRMWR